MKQRINITIDDWLLKYAKDNHIVISKLINDNLFFLINRYINLRKLNEKDLIKKIEIANTKWTD